MTHRVITLLALICTFVITANAATIYLTQSDPNSTVHSYDTAGNWDNALAPSSENDYIVNNGYLLRTLYNGTGSVFGGNSLTLTGGGRLLLSAAASITYTINNFTVDNGTVSAGSARRYVVKGDITLQSGGINVSAGTTSDNRGVLIDANITGNGGFNVLVGASGYVKDVYINGQATYTGSTTVGQYATLGVYGTMLIDVNDGSNSNISGLGSLVLDSALRFDVTGVTTEEGSWSIIDVDNLVESYGDNFGVALSGGQTFSETQPGIWTLADGSNNWEFDQSTGILILTQIPEPGTMTVLSVGILVTIGRRKRLQRKCLV